MLNCLLAKKFGACGRRGTRRREMKKKFLYLGLVLIFGASGGICPAAAAVVGLYDMAFYVDGTYYESQAVGTDPTTMALPANLNVSGFDQTTGLGTLVWTTSTPGYTNSFLSSTMKLMK